MTLNKQMYINFQVILTLRFGQKCQMFVKIEMDKQKKRYISGDYPVEINLLDFLVPLENILFQEGKRDINHKNVK